MTIINKRALKRLPLHQLMDLKVDYAFKQLFGSEKNKVYEEIYKELEELAMKDDRLIDAFTAWEELSKTQEEIIAYHSRLKVLIDEEAKLDYAEHKGIQKGIEQGKEQMLKQLILKMIANGSDNEAIQALTEVSIEEIEALRKQR